VLRMLPSLRTCSWQICSMHGRCARCTRLLPSCHAMPFRLPVAAKLHSPACGAEA
jgi:hypothetical protein